MHDPMTVAFEIKSPIRGKPSQWSPKGYRSALVTIWHRDPERRGPDPRSYGDDSCGWPWPMLTKEELAHCDRLIDSEFDNVRGWFGKWDEADPRKLEGMKSDLRQAFRLFKSFHRPWWKHPRWHLWHWEFQVHPIQTFKRWAFSRCANCHKGFSWGYCVIGGSWEGTGPLWFRSEKNVFHENCSYMGSANKSVAVAASQIVIDPKTEPPLA